MDTLARKAMAIGGFLLLFVLAFAVLPVFGLVAFVLSIPILVVLVQL